MKMILRCSRGFLARSPCAGPPAIAQSLSIEPLHTKVCWVVRIPNRWNFTSEDRRLYQNDVNVVEFRHNPTADGENPCRRLAVRQPPGNKSLQHERLLDLNNR